MLNLAKALGDAGLEVIYTELQDPLAIVKSALQESVDHIGITTLPGADIRAFYEIKRFLKEEDSDHISITAGGFLAKEDISKVKALGVLEFFPKGTSLIKTLRVYPLISFNAYILEAHIKYTPNPYFVSPVAAPCSFISTFSSRPW